MADFWQDCGRMFWLSHANMILMKYIKKVLCLEVSSSFTINIK